MFNKIEKEEDGGICCQIKQKTKDDFRKRIYGVTGCTLRLHLEEFFIFISRSILLMSRFLLILPLSERALVLLLKEVHQNVVVGMQERCLT